MITPVFWKERRIPTWLAMLVLLLGISAGVVAIQRPSLPFIQAAPEIVPDQIEITNLTQNSFTVSWVTSQSATGLVKYGDNNQTQLVARDVRDPLTGNFGQYTTHLINISGLSPNSSYAFTIQSNDRTYDNNGSPYAVKTAPSASQPSATVDFPNGTIITPNGQPAAGALVYLRAQNLSPMSTIADPVGKWSFNLNNGRTQDLANYFTFDPQTHTFQLFIHGGDQPNSTVTFLVKDQQQLPQITLGQDYDYRSIEADEDEEVAGGGRFDFAPPVGAEEPTSADEIVIWNPEPDEGVATSYPLFLGSGPANVTLNISLQPLNPITDTVITDDRGYWQWSPPTALSLGEHDFTASYTDAQGIDHQLVRSFTVLTVDVGLPAIEASPSADLSPTPTISLVISPTPTTVFELSPTPSPTRAPTATPTVRPTATPTSSGAPTAIPTPTPAVPVSGVTIPTIGLTGLGMVLMGIGVMLIL